jgi:hypothetical protein
MKIIAQQKDFRIEFNGSSTYIILDSNNDAWYCVDTLKKAQNRLKKIIATSGV